MHILYFIISFFTQISRQLINVPLRSVVLILWYRFRWLIPVHRTRTVHRTTIRPIHQLSLTVSTYRHLAPPQHRQPELYDCASPRPLYHFLIYRLNLFCKCFHAVVESLVRRPLSSAIRYEFGSAEINQNRYYGERETHLNEMRSVTFFTSWPLPMTSITLHWSVVFSLLSIFSLLFTSVSSAVLLSVTFEFELIGASESILILSDHINWKYKNETLNKSWIVAKKVVLGKSLCCAYRYKVRKECARNFYLPLPKKLRDIGKLSIRIEYLRPNFS